MPLINGKFIQRIAETKFVQKNMSLMNEKKFDKVSNILPPIESLWATTLYVETIQMSRNIPDERKKPLVWQSIIGGGTGIAFSIFVFKAIDKYKNNIVKHLEKLNIKDSNKVIKGAKIAIPLLITSFIMRYVVSVASVPLSVHVSKWYDKVRKES